MFLEDAVAIGLRMVLKGRAKATIICPLPPGFRRWMHLLLSIIGWIICRDEDTQGQK